MKKPLQLLRKGFDAFGACILVYHQIEESLFKEHINTIGKKNIISLDELVNRKKEGMSLKGKIAITLDDCYKRTLGYLAPLCHEEKIPITCFVPTAFIDGAILPRYRYNNIKFYSKGAKLNIQGQEYDFSDSKQYEVYFKKLHDLMYFKSEKEYGPIWKEISAQLIAKGIASAAQLSAQEEPVTWDFIAKYSTSPYIHFESHGCTHQPLVGLDRHEILHEFISSKQKIETITQREVKHFCYPYGDRSNIGETALQQIADYYESAVTMERGRVHVSTSLTYMPRIPLYNKDHSLKVLLKLLVK